MLSFARVSTHMGRHYYTGDNYYTQNKGVERSEWFGTGAEHLGLSGLVAPDAFQRLLEGKNPDTDSHLTPNHSNKELTRRAALDLTFSAPKSVSLAALVGGDHRLIKAHERAVDFALSVCQERYSTSRLGGKFNRQEEATGNLIVAKFHHDTSRAKDPQLHTHCVTMNAVLRSDGHWRSLHNDGIFNNSKLLGLIYQNELARSVREIGYNIELKPNGTFEISGYTEEQLKSFSKRREKIAELGAENQKDARHLVMVDREAKGKEIPREILLAQWTQEAFAAEIAHPKPIPERDLAAQYLETAEVIKMGMQHATEHDVSFKREQVESFALESHLGKIKWKDLSKDFRIAEHFGELIRTDHGRFTTAESVSIEDDILSSLKAARGSAEVISKDVPRRISENILGLTTGQKSALTLSLTSHDSFLAWQGVAGAGKTFAMNVLREEAESNGFSVRGFAPSAEAAKTLETEGKLPSTTVASLLVSESSNVTATEPRKLWIVDEAGLLSAKDCRDIMKRAQSERARVIFVGDTRQLSSVGAGNPFKLLQQGGIQTAFLDESRRQKREELKVAVAEMAAGNMAAGLLKINDSIFELRKESTRIEHATRAYLEKSKKVERDVLVLAGTNRERILLTQNIRDGLKARGDLGETFNLTTLRSKQLSREEIQQGTKIVSGDVLIFHRAYPSKQITSNQRLEVVETSNQILRLRNAEGHELRVSSRKHPAFNVYEKHECEFANGDRIRFTRNDRRLGVRNGQDAVVIGHDEKTFTLQTADKKVISFPREDYVHIDHNYVNTVFSSQGKTCDHVIVCTDKSFGKEALYVSVSRAKFGVDIFCEDKEKLLSTALMSRAKKSALELIHSENEKILASLKIDQAKQTEAIQNELIQGDSKSISSTQTHNLGKNVRDEMEISN